MRREEKKWTRLIMAVSLVGLLVSLAPNTLSLYQLTGETGAAGKLVGIAHWLNTAVRPAPHLAPDAGVQHADVSPFGVNTFIQLEAEISKREESLRLAKAAGFTHIRQEFTWEDIEIHAKGDFEDRRHDPFVDAWAKYDNIVDLAEQQEIEIIARLSNPPAWSRALPVEQTGSLAPPDDYTDFADFAAIVAERYRGRITYYQLWNEPNGNEEWGNHQDVNAEQYVELLCEAYGRIKGVDPNAVILAGALTPTVEHSGRNLSHLVFLERMYAAGAANCFDIMSAQGYGLFSGATDQRLRPTVINYPHHLFLRDIMVRHGDEEKPIWISEMGWNVVPDGLPQPFGQVTEAEQAQFTVEAFQRVGEWPWVGVVNVWFLKRPFPEPDQPFTYFRLLEPDFTPLPVYNAIADYATDDPQLNNRPRWQFQWERVRRPLFLLSIAFLFLTLLNSLTIDN